MNESKKESSKETKKDTRVRDLQPKKDAKGGVTVEPSSPPPPPPSGWDIKKNLKV
jgi:hypothetical protein